MKTLDHDSAERLAIKFFPHLMRACAIALVQKLWEIYFPNEEKSP